MSGTLIEMMELQPIHVDKSAPGRVLALGSLCEIIIHCRRENEHRDDGYNAYSDTLGSKQSLWFFLTVHLKSLRYQRMA